MTNPAEINRLIAKKVMGWTIHKDGRWSFLGPMGPIFSAPLDP